MTRRILNTRPRFDRADGLARRASLAIMALGSFGCIVRESEPEQHVRLAVSFVSFLLVALIVFLFCTGFLVFVSSRRRRQTLTKILVALVAGSVCGALWFLMLDTLVDTANPEATTDPAGLGVGAVTAIVVTVLLLRRNRPAEVVELAAMAIGFHSLALPLIALISFLLGGAEWFAAASFRPEFRAVILGVRLAGDLRTVGLSVGGLFLGVALVFVGDRARRHAMAMRPRPRLNLS